MPEIIADTSPLQYLFQVELLNLLQVLYGHITIPEAVSEELAQGRARSLRVPDPASFSWMQIRHISGPDMLPATPGLGRGERAVLDLALKTPDSLVLLDDALARRHAKLAGVAFTGTLGVLLKAKQSGFLDAVTPVLDQLEVLRFRLDPTTRAAVLRLAGESAD